jgi:hypothetical protein
MKKISTVMQILKRFGVSKRDFARSLSEEPNLEVKVSTERRSVSKRSTKEERMYIRVASQSVRVNKLSPIIHSHRLRDHCTEMLLKDLSKPFIIKFRTILLFKGHGFE